MAESKIRAIYFFEMLGKPPEYIKESLEEFISKLDSQSGVNVICKTVHEPKQLEKEGEKEFFTSFAEVEVEVDNLSVLFGICLHMLPSHIEILIPDELRLKNFELGNIISELAIKLHRYDEIAKILTLEKNNLLKRLNEMQIKLARGRIKVEEIVDKNEEEKKSGNKKGNENEEKE